ncbi:hypothetical protein ACPA9J_32945 [Pseudomonas aeruginosa]
MNFDTMHPAQGMVSLLGTTYKSEVWPRENWKTWVSALSGFLIGVARLKPRAQRGDPGQADASRNWRGCRLDAVAVGGGLGRAVGIEGATHVQNSTVRNWRWSLTNWQREQQLRRRR